MNTPTTPKNDLAALRAECDVLRLLLALVIRKKIDREHAPGIGEDMWRGPDMAGVVTGLGRPDGCPSCTWRRSPGSATACAMQPALGGGRPR